MNLLSSATVFSFFTLISRILGYLRDILIAIFLGASIFADAFFVAFRLPNTFRRLFAEGTFNAAFIPSYASAKIEDKKKGKKVCRRCLKFFITNFIIYSNNSRNFYSILNLHHCTRFFRGSGKI